MDPSIDIAKAHDFIRGFHHWSHDAQSCAIAECGAAVCRRRLRRGSGPEMAAIATPSLLAPFVWTSRPQQDKRGLDSPWRSDANTSYSSERTHPDFYASASDSDGAVVRGFTAHGPYVLYQLVAAPETVTACDNVIRTVENQLDLIDHYVPTDPAKMAADLPNDPTGYLKARTLQSSDDRRPFNGGWRPEAWLHFESNPVQAASLFRDAGLEWVSRQ